LYFHSPENTKFRKYRFVILVTLNTLKIYFDLSPEVTLLYFQSPDNTHTFVLSPENTNFKKKQIFIFKHHFCLIIQILY
jgi:hypothetical protein